MKAVHGKAVALGLPYPSSFYPFRRDNFIPSAGKTLRSAIPSAPLSLPSSLQAAGLALFAAGPGVVLQVFRFPSAPPTRQPVSEKGKRALVRSLPQDLRLLRCRRAAFTCACSRDASACRAPPARMASRLRRTHNLELACPGHAPSSTRMRIPNSAPLHLVALPNHRSPESPLFDSRDVQASAPHALAPVRAALPTFSLLLVPSPPALRFIPLLTHSMPRLRLPSWRRSAPSPNFPNGTQPSRTSTTR